MIASNPDEFGDQQRIQASYDWITRRTVSIGYYALVDINRVTQKKTEPYESVWHPVRNLPPLLMDHGEIVQQAIGTLQLNLDRKLIAFNLLPETFTMKELQAIYEAVYEKPFASNSFQKKILALNVLERLGKKFTGGPHKAPYLYRFLK